MDVVHDYSPLLNTERRLYHHSGILTYKLERQPFKSFPGFEELVDRARLEMIYARGLLIPPGFTYTGPKPQSSQAKRALRLNTTSKSRRSYPVSAPTVNRVQAAPPHDALMPESAG